MKSTKVCTVHGTGTEISTVQTPTTMQVVRIVVEWKHRTQTIHGSHSESNKLVLDSLSSNDCVLSSSQEADPEPPPHSLAVHHNARILGQPCRCTSPAGQLALQ